MTEERKARGLELIVKNLEILNADIYEKTKTFQKLVQFLPEEFRIDFFNANGFLLMSKDLISILILKLENFQNGKK